MENSNTSTLSDKSGNVSDDTINLKCRSLQELAQLKKRLESDIQMLSDQGAQLKYALNGFKSSKESLAALHAGNMDKQILVPITQSLYVPGKMSNTNTILVDIGTGYLVEKTISEGEVFCDKKVNLVRENLAMQQKALNSKKNTLELCALVMQEKMALAQKAKS
eukprot:GHVL01010500.1.p1 GENE.GHVL01010500.1~~GHVL01010500.1.p1  ORF type:complete len:176 (+),score=34.40 GHVL01010500.1:38-529(+)